MWTDEQVAKLKKLWDEGYSAAMIGAELSYTRNAILGKVFRLGLESRADGPKFSKPRAPRSPRPRRSGNMSELSRILARAASQRYREKRRTVTNSTYRKNHKGSKTSADYRSHLPPMPEMSKSDLRAMLRAAVENTI